MGIVNNVYMQVLEKQEREKCWSLKETICVVLVGDVNS
jgi:hypothetical protein